MSHIKLTVQQKRWWLTHHAYKEDTMERFVRDVPSTTDFYVINKEMTCRSLCNKKGLVIHKERLAWGKMARIIRDLFNEFAG